MSSAQNDSEPSGQTLPAGTRIEEFVIERVLGSGGFGITYLARDTSLNRQVVIKENLPAQFAWRETTTGTVRPRHTSGGDADDYEWSMNNFLREAETLASLDHPGIVRVLRKFETNGTAYFVMPFVQGIAFDQLITERQQKNQPFTEEELRGLLERMLDALGYLHDRGIYHRDIKPGNILISNQGVPALIDFGSARQRLSDRSMTVVESAGYTPFEQLQTRGDVGPWSDLYALGATIEKAITFKAPPKAADRIGKDPRIPLATRQELVQKYSPALLASIDRALAVDDKERWQNAGQWQKALEAEQPPGPVKSAESERRPRRGLVVGVAVLAVLGIVVWIFNRRDPASEPPAVATEQSPAATPVSNEQSTSSQPKPASPFAAAAMAPAIWEQMAKSGDPLAQALLGDALYWGGQKNHGIQMDPAEAVKWIEKSANTGHPLGRYLLGLARSGDGKWLPKDEELAKQDYAEALRLGLLRDAESGGPVWWTAVAQVLEQGKGVAADPKAAATWYRRAAETGYIDAMNGLAYCYDTGVGVKENDSVAVSWFRKAAEAGSSGGMARLGDFYQSGRGVPKNPSEAVKWYRKAADLGDAVGQTRLGECHTSGDGVPKDLTEAINWYQKAADQGYAQAQILLGIAYEFGDGVTEDATMAAKWYRMAAEQGDAEGQANLGDCYRHGEGVPEDAAVAVKWYRLAAEQGEVSGQNGLGLCYDEGKGVLKDMEKAVKWYRKAADQGFAMSQLNLGFCYMNGEGVAKDPIEAAKWYHKAAENGLAEAKNRLGVCYYLGNGVSQNAVEAVKWCRLAADQGHAGAQTNLGYCYANGEGVAKDEVESFKWYQKAADQGHAGAQNDLGYCYAKGQGVAKDQVAAAKWYQKAADQGHTDAQLSLGICYSNGEGITTNISEGVKLYKKAAEAGHATAQFLLGLRYSDGSGVPKDKVMAYAWLKVASDSGHEESSESLKILALQMTSAEIAESQRLGSEWKVNKEKDPFAEQ
jgi:TPR repeat protein